MVQADMIGRTETADRSSEVPADASLRRCIASGRSFAPERMIRFVVSPDGVVVADIDRRLPGRGIWVTAERAALEKAVAGKLFARAAKRQVVVPADLVQQVERQLLQRALDTLGLARRAGQAVSGWERVREFTRARAPGLWLLAHDAGADARRRMASMAGDTPVLHGFDAAELGAAFGRDQAIFVAFAQGNLARRLLADAGRLDGLRDADVVQQDENRG